MIASPPLGSTLDSRLTIRLELGARFLNLPGESFCHTVRRNEIAPTRTPRFSSAASSKNNGPLRCIEILGGNLRRTEALLLGGLEVLLLARSKGEAGRGDIYCIHSCGSGALAKFVLVDLTGHGQARSAFARVVHGLLHRFGDETQPARLLELLNQQYSRVSYPPIYATAVSAEPAAETLQDSTLVKLAAAFLRREEQYRGQREFEDDITLLWLRRLPPDTSGGLESKVGRNTRRFP